GGLQDKRAGAIGGTASPGLRAGAREAGQAGRPDVGARNLRNKRACAAGSTAAAGGRAGVRRAGAPIEPEECALGLEDKGAGARKIAADAPTRGGNQDGQVVAGDGCGNDGLCSPQAVDIRDGVVEASVGSDQVEREDTLREVGEGVAEAVDIHPVAGGAEVA